MWFTGTRNVDLICQLVKDLREYGNLRLERFELDMSSKIALAVGMLAVCAIVSVLALVVLMFLSLALAYALAPVVGSTALAMLIIALLYGILASVVVVKRQEWIVTPLMLFIHDIFISEKNKKDE